MDQEKEPELQDKPLALFLSDTYTRNQATRRFRLVKDFVNYQAFGSTSQGGLNQAIKSFKAEYVKINERSETEEDMLFLDGLGEAFFQSFKISSLKEDFEQFEKELEATKLVIVYIPFEMPIQEIRKLGVWLKSTLGLETIFDLRFDGNLIGGCALSYRGVYKDLSLKSRIEEHKKQVIDTLISFKSR